MNSNKSICFIKTNCLPHVGWGNIVEKIIKEFIGREIPEDKLRIEEQLKLYNRVQISDVKPFYDAFKDEAQVFTFNN